MDGTTLSEISPLAKSNFYAQVPGCVENADDGIADLTRERIRNSVSLGIPVRMNS